MPNTSNIGRDHYRHFLTIPTRWMDNDVYGHVNNVVYYSFFDTVVNKFLIEQGQLDYSKGKVIGLVGKPNANILHLLLFRMSLLQV